MTHTANKQFAKALQDCTLTWLKKEEFRRFRDRLPLGSEDREEADRLWAACEQRGERAERHERVGAATVGVQGGRGQAPGRGARRNQPRTVRGDARPPRRDDTDNAGGVDSKLLGEPFHNPYTFLPFPSEDWFRGKRARRHPTPLTQEESDRSRFTGIVEVELVTLSPLLTANPKETRDETGHKTYSALALADDVIVPATGVRGSLRTLLTILAGGTLSYLDESAWLVQGRDLPLGPAGKTSAPSVPRKCFLARIVQPGTETRDGTVQLGTTRLSRAADLESLRRPLPRPRQGERIRHLWLDEGVTSISESRDSRHPWQLKLSGPPVNPKGKREGLFLDDGPLVTLPSRLWRAYLGRNRHGLRPELQRDDLVWLEAKEGLTEIRAPDDLESIQWARWGRRGEALEAVIRRDHRQVLPDAFNPDGLVDEVTDLFGQVPADKTQRQGAAGPFAARVRPENLVFRDAAKDGLEKSVVLAPLAPPHPGCAAFYRDETDPDRVTSTGKPLRGYKVYRTTTERGATAAWRFGAQGVYGKDGRLEPEQQKVNKSCDLLKEGSTGKLKLSCRSLSRREVALLLLACSVDWRVGGGKPLGLGHCRVQRVVVRDETGAEVAVMQRKGDGPAELPEPYRGEVTDLIERRDLWHRSQLPVPKLRYPRAVTENRKGKSRGGHVWFGRHANPRKNAEPGLQVLWTAGELATGAGGDRVRAQPLPRFDPEAPTDGALYGYDLFAGEGSEWREQSGNLQTRHKKLEPFSPEEHARASDHSGGERGQSRTTRAAERKQRRGG